MFFFFSQKHWISSKILRRSVGCCELDFWEFFQFLRLQCHIFSDWRKHKTNGFHCFETASGCVNNSFQSFLENISSEQKCWSTFSWENRIPEQCPHEIYSALGFSLRVWAQPLCFCPQLRYLLQLGPPTFKRCDPSMLLSAMSVIEFRSPGLLKSQFGNQFS